MILVSFSGFDNLHSHDNNICVYNNGEIKYLKCEREFGIKHATCSPDWYKKKLKEWNIDYRDVDAFITTGIGPEDDSGLSPFATVIDNEKTLDLVSYPIRNKKSKNFACNHHFAHAYSNLDFELGKSKSIVLDGFGHGHNSSWFYNSKFKEIKMYQYKSAGIILDELGDKIGLGGSFLDWCGKIMGLQSYGQPDFNFINEWKGLLPYQSHLFAEWVREYPIVCDFKDQKFLDFVATVFWTCYELNSLYFKNFSKGEQIQFSGGTALNVNWNRHLFDLGYDLNIQPHVNDEGLSVGGLRFLCDMYEVPFEISNFPYCQDDESPKDVPTVGTINRVAELLADNKIVGWYQGHGEIGPRALGNRSILMNPSIKNGKDIINQKVKHREWWRPFGASVKEDKASEYFDLDKSPYMLYASNVLNDDMKSITHIDGTCRHQTVTPEQNSLFYDLLDAFESKTGLPVLLNTSLNLGGKPIAGKIEEAIELFNTSEMDALCVGNDLYIK